VPEGISITLLTKNCARSLADTLESLKSFILPSDEVICVDTGSTDDTVSVARSFGARVYEHPELNVPGMLDLVKKHLPEHYTKCAEDPQFTNGFIADFSAARTLCDSYAKNDLTFWLDSDDILVGGGALRAQAAEYFDKPENSVLFMAYDYSFDEDGRCSTVLWRERILRRSLYKWAGVCHESKIPINGRPNVVVKVDPTVSRLLHKHGRAHIYSDIRNYAILLEAHQNADWKDPRWEFYLGNAARGLSRWHEAIAWYSKTLQRSGSREDRLACALNIGYCHILFHRPWRAIDWFNQAIKIDANDPRSYYGIARCHFDLKRWRDVITFSGLGDALGKPENQLTAVDPHAFDYYPGVFVCLALKELGQVEAACAKAQEIHQIRPDLPAGQGLLRDVMRWAEVEQLKGAVSLVLSTSFSQEASLDVIKAIKPEIRKQIPEFQIEPFINTSTPSITFLCGKTAEPWDPTSEATGVGGSEKMVINLARGFAARGIRVEVYGSPKAENRYKVFDGVTYRPVESFNPNLERDVIVIWRNWGYLDFPLRARKIYMDLHDVQDPSAITPARLARLSGVLFKSAFHAEPIRSILPAAQTIVSRNGIDPAAFPSITRNLKKIVYCSSGDRGLLGALKIFARAKAIHPDLEMDVYYGFTPLYLERAATQEYQYFGDCQAERHMLDYAEECFELCDRLGVRYHGRIGHKALATVLSSASIWLYPTMFPEISCMTAMEAQAAGCLPIVSDIAALKETVQYGLRLDPADHDTFVRAICEVLDKGSDYDTYRAEMSDWARKTFAFDSLVTALLQEFECQTSPPSLTQRSRSRSLISSAKSLPLILGASPSIDSTNPRSSGSRGSKSVKTSKPNSTATSTPSAPTSTTSIAPSCAAAPGV
jgi:glycosyltransferase involved in cell wall biosynthesis